MHRLQELVRLHRSGRGAREVARLLGMSPNTERTYRNALAAAALLEGDPGQLPELEELKQAIQGELPVKAAPQQVSSLQEVLPEIEKMAGLGAYPKAIHDTLRLRHEGFEGKLSAVKRAWRAWKKRRGVRAEDVAIPVETGPGQVAQVDFGYVGTLVDPATGKARRAWVFTCVLGFSRHLFAKIVFDQRAETWAQLHVEAFAWFGGVPATLVPDNLKAAVIRAAFGADREQDGLHRTYVELARHYRFEVDPAPPRQPKKKGKVESGVKYVKRNFFLPRALEDAGAAQAELKRWLLEIAGQRDHGTTHMAPLRLFEAEEKAALKPLPATPYVPVTWKRATVHPNSHVVFDQREYSVPWKLIGQRVWIRSTPDTVYVYADDERVATHDRRSAGPRSTVESHLPEHRRDLRHRSKEYWVERARQMADSVASYIEEVFGADDVLSRLRPVQAIVTHLEKHPVERAIGACERARAYGAYTYVAVRDILRQGLDRLPPQQQALVEPRSQPSSPAYSRVPRHVH